MKKNFLITIIILSFKFCFGQERSDLENYKQPISNELELDEGYNYEDRYVHIRNKNTKKIGLYDYIQNKIVIPIEFNYIYQNGNYWIIDIKDESYFGDRAIGVYDSNFNQILPLSFERINVINNFIYTEKEINNKLDRLKDIYNSQGKNITQGRFQEIIGGFSDGLQLVKIVPNDYSKNHDFIFIDSLGNSKLRFSGKDYYEVSPFKSGRSLISIRGKKDKEGYTLVESIKGGYINKEGKLVIPFIYERASSFLSETALVATKTNWLIINRDGKVLKYLRRFRKGDFPMISILENSSPTFYFSDDEVYDEYGKIIK